MIHYTRHHASYWEPTIASAMEAWPFPILVPGTLHASPQYIRDARGYLYWTLYAFRKPYLGFTSTRFDVATFRKTPLTLQANDIGLWIGAAPYHQPPSDRPVTPVVLHGLETFFAWVVARGPGKALVKDVPRETIAQLMDGVGKWYPVACYTDRFVVQASLDESSIRHAAPGLNHGRFIETFHSPSPETNQENQGARGTS